MKNTRETSRNNYGVFCIAAALLRQDEGLFYELDTAWNIAEALYEDFLKSTYNDVHSSEIDCINNYMNKIK